MLQQCDAVPHLQALPLGVHWKENHRPDPNHLMCYKGLLVGKVEDLEGVPPGLACVYQPPLQQPSAHDRLQLTTCDPVLVLMHSHDLQRLPFPQLGNLQQSALLRWATKGHGLHYLLHLTRTL